MTSPIADRIRELLVLRDISARELADRSKFKTLSQVSNTMTRLDKDPDKAELGTLRKIAKGGGVRWQWLLTGEMPRDLGTRVEGIDRYPNRAKAITALEYEVLPEAIAELRIVAMDSPNDLTVGEWIDDLRAIDRRLKRGQPQEGAARAKADTAHAVEMVRPEFADLVVKALPAPKSPKKPRPRK